MGIRSLEFPGILGIPRTLRFLGISEIQPNRLHLGSIHLAIRTFKLIYCLHFPLIPPIKILGFSQATPSHWVFSRFYLLYGPIGEHIEMRLNQLEIILDEPLFEMARAESDLNKPIGERIEHRLLYRDC